ncbi:uncharacterized protein PV06_06145 [Exophiala oligosperma]|uniref:HD domain-containing protein n=1 Tax=Exophiala oligosperma TaxID=215243 RepID=A0A0D2DHY4_9EURO|nr:uncharacterized protein PV06_06145 [Exophiala oligosperma]KIW42613.1 hypothetical protein PV06_06145 [Exophiala oligosperma]
MHKVRSPLLPACKNVNGGANIIVNKDNVNVHECATPFEATCQPTMCLESARAGAGETGSSSNIVDAAVRAALRVNVPQGSALCADAFDLMMAALPLPIIHHSLRVYLLANWLAGKEQSRWADSVSLFVACICHDFGASRLHDGPQRFEVEGADVAADLLRKHHESEQDAHEVWTAIALHTSPGIAERITPLARLVRLGVLIDFRPPTRQELDAVSFAEGIESKLPRLDIEMILGDAVVEQAVRNPKKAPAASWPGILYKAYLENPERRGVNPAF